MPFQITDQTSNTQRIAASNSGGFAFGPSTPDTGLRVALRKIFEGYGLTTGSVPSAGVNRIVGSVVLTSQNVTSVMLSRNVVGFGTIPGAFILGIGGNRMEVAFPERNAGINRTFNYSVY